jgi:two-component system, cell cycle response regulator DivK
VGGELILIVDDTEMNVRLARDVLRYAGFRTLEAGTAGEGVSLAAEHHPDLILMDIRLPDMDGVAALHRLRDDPATAGIPVVALTSFVMKGDRDRFLGEGFDGYLEKPISVKAFPNQVRSHLGSRTRE